MGQLPCRSPRSGPVSARRVGGVPLHAPLCGDIRAPGQAHDGPALQSREPGHLAGAASLLKPHINVLVCAHLWILAQFDVWSIAWLIVLA
jgi:hypothetical protein